MVTKAAERYLNFSDNTMQDRLAAHAAALARDQPKSKRSSSQPALKPALEPSGPCEGWDKYYFFSVPAGGTHVGPTAMLGRRRPAAHGPQTFCNESFSKDRIQRERGRIEKKGGGSGTNYGDFFSQFPRSATATLGLPNYEGQPFATNASNALSPGTLARIASDSLLQKPPPPMAMSCKTQERERLGPHWPPKTEQRPDSLTTRQTLFPGGHRTFVDLFSADRRAERGCGYSVFVG
jgi:hypothetical protein